MVRQVGCPRSWAAALPVRPAISSCTRATADAVSPAGAASSGTTWGRRRSWGTSFQGASWPLRACAISSVRFVRGRGWASQGARRDPFLKSLGRLRRRDVTLEGCYREVLHPWVTLRCSGPYPPHPPPMPRNASDCAPGRRQGCGRSDIDLNVSANAAGSIGADALSRFRPPPWHRSRRIPGHRESRRSGCGRRCGDPPALRSSHRP